MNRRHFLGTTLAGLLVPRKASAEAKDEARDIGSRRELFVDDWLIEKLDGVGLTLHPPTPREVAVRFNQEPWEGIDTAYVTVFRDADRLRMYYRGNPPGQPEVYCYAESKDGITWTKPRLGLFPFKGSKDTNIVWSGRGTHNFAPFKDGNLAAPEAERYKALGGGPLIAFASPDGLHWKPLRDQPVITKGAFDSQNLAFWDGGRGLYVAFVRDFVNGVRAIRTCTSKDFLTWTEPTLLKYGDAPAEHFYTNAVTPYFRAPHLYLGFPKRFVEHRKVLTGQEYSGVSDTVFMTSRDGLHWDRRFREAFIRPGPDRLNWMHRSNMTAWGVVQTGSEELSLYYGEHYNTPTNQLRRATLRLDGFASVRAGAAGGEFVTRPLRFEGNQLLLNFATSAAGSLRVEVQWPDGKPIPGLGLAECPEIYGDEIERAVSWKGGRDLGRLAGRGVRLRFVMRDADLYALRFTAAR